MSPTNHEPFMRHCIELAAQAKVAGNTPVGAVIVRDGTIIAEGLEAVVSHHDVTAHAEINAIRGACTHLGSRDLAGCVLYSTAEPCVMCSYAIRQAHIAAVVLGTFGAKVGGITSAYPLLIDETVPGWSTSPEVIGPVLQNECEALFL